MPASRNNIVPLSNRSQRNGAGNVPPPTAIGRPVGSQNKTTRILKEAVLLAAEQVGEDGRGAGKLVGYLRRVARDEPRAFCALLQRILPLQVTAKFDVDVALNQKYSTIEEATTNLRQLGVPIHRLYEAAEEIEDSNE